MAVEQYQPPSSLNFSCYLFQFRVLKGKLGSIVSVLLLCWDGYWAVVVLVQHLPTEQNEPKAKSGKQLSKRLTDINNTFSLTLSPHTHRHPLGVILIREVFLTTLISPPPLLLALQSSDVPMFHGEAVNRRVLPLQQYNTTFLWLP